MNKQSMQHLDHITRRKNFDEVSLGYSHEEALNEAKRCLQCKHKPCVSACPVNIDIPTFIRHILNDDLDESLKTINKYNLFPAICGRVCPQESQCESKCVRGIKGESVAIGRLERFVADNTISHVNAQIIENNIKVAVVGSGPSGLTCANELRKLGYDVTIFEALHIPGGVLAYGIPEFRLPKKLVSSEVQKLVAMGVNIKTNTVIGKTITIDQLKEDNFKAIYIASGAGLPKFMNLEGENLNGVFSANEYLTRINLMKSYLEESDTPIYPSKNVCVIGGGNVAMDAARCAVRMGSENVYIIYRRGLEEMPARNEEIQHAKEEGIHFKLLTNPTKIIGDDTFKVTGIKCVEMVLGDEDASGRRKPIEKENSEFIIECDTVILALGNYSNPLLTKSTKGLDVNKHGCIVVDENLQTSLSGVFAGGDIVTGAATVILAMGAGKQASVSIDEYIKKSGK